MKAIIPVAGFGTRLRPHTYTLPKALLHVAGKPILGHILDQVRELGITDVILILGYLGHKIKEYVESDYKDMNFVYANQETALGLGHAIYVAAPFVHGNEQLLIIYGDTIFMGDIKKGMKKSGDGSIGVKLVNDPRRFGVVEKKGNVISKLVEKPDIVKPMPAIVGVNFINNSDLLFSCLKEIVEKGIKTKEEFQLTDAFQLMVKKGAKLSTFKLDGWFDCGKPETLLATNQYLLKLKNGGKPYVSGENSIVIPPVFVGKGVVLKNSIIGPFVSIDKNAIIDTSIVKNSIINRNAQVVNAQFTDSLIGENAIVKDIVEKLNVGDNSEISFSGED